MAETPWLDRPLTVGEVDRKMRVAKDVKKEFHLCKDDGWWYWSDSDESDNTEAWHGPFMCFSDCLNDAVEPYLTE